MEHSHKGTVSRVHNGTVTAKITVVSGCSSCEARSSCTMIESSSRDIKIATTDWQSYRIGEEVEIIVDSQNGMRAIWLAYLLPAILLVAVFCLLNQYVGEVMTALGTLLFVAIYWLVLWISRKKTERKFSFKIRHTEENQE